MNKTPFHRFIDLVSYDQSVNSLQKKLTLLKEKIEHFNQQKLDAFNLIEQAKRTVYDLCKKRDHLDFEIAMLSEKKKKTAARLSAGVSPREYESLQQQLEMLSQQVDTCEDQLIRLWQDIEIAEQKRDESIIQSKKQCSEYDRELALLNAEYVQRLQEYDTIKKERVGMLPTIPQVWIERYDAMRSRISNPVVHVQQGSCPGCFSQIPNSKKDELRRHVLVTCQGCHRILYEV